VSSNALVPSLISVMFFSGFLVAPALAASDSADSGDSSDLGEIVVTGEKRDEHLVDTPVVTQVFSADTITQAGIQQPSDFLSLTPNVNFYTAENPGDFLVNIRGLTSVRLAEPSVALIVDGVPVASSAEFNAALFDVQQIEVTKGPEDAYYGRDASAGAILITTKAPGNDYSGQASLDYGNFNTINVNASFGGPIIANVLKFRFALSEAGSDGPYTDVNTGEHVDRFHELIGRGRLDWDVNEALKLDLRFTLGTGIGGALAYTPDIGIVPGLSPNGTVVHGYPVTQVGSNFDFTSIPYTSDLEGRYHRDLGSTSLKADYTLPFATLTSITAYSTTRELFSGKSLPYSDPADTSTDFGAWAAIFGDKGQNFENDNFAIDQEFRLTSTGTGPLRWQLGFQYVSTRQVYTDDGTLDGSIPANLIGGNLTGYDGYTNGVLTLVGGGNVVPWPLAINPVTSPYASTSYDRSKYTGEDFGPFANADYNITDALQLRLAGRFDSERRTVSDETPDVPNPFAGGASYNACVVYLTQTANQCLAGERKTFQEFQPKITLDYKIPDFGSIYASWGRGFKTGGFNPEGTRAEELASYTNLYISEGQSAGQAAASAAAVVKAQDYYNKEIDDTSEIGFKSNLYDGRLFLEGAFFNTEVTNAQSYSFDPVSNVQAVESIDKERIYGIDFDFNARLTNALTFYGGVGWIHSRITALASNPEDVGNKPPYAPEYTGNLGVQFAQPLVDGLTFVTRVDYELTGPTWFDIANTLGTERDRYGLLNLRVGVTNSMYEFTLWAKNLTDSHYLTDNFPVTSAIDALSIGVPRTYGFEVRAKF
jgi:iron complex outermembrane receptor protein